VRKSLLFTILLSLLTWAASVRSTESIVEHGYNSFHKDSFDHTVSGIIKSRHESEFVTKVTKFGSFVFLDKSHTELLAGASVVKSKLLQIEEGLKTSIVSYLADAKIGAHRNSLTIDSDEVRQERSRIDLELERLLSAREESSNSRFVQKRRVLSVEPEENSISQTVRRFVTRVDRRAERTFGSQEFNPLRYEDNVEEVDCKLGKIRVIETISHRVYSRDKTSRTTPWVDVSSNPDDASIAEYVCSR
jgi:hypothetical protein